MTTRVTCPTYHEIRAALTRSLAHVARASIEPLGEGWAFWAFRAGDRALRFPKSAEFTQTLAVEAAVMRELAPALPLPVSGIEVHEDGPNGLPFTSHRWVGGVQVADLDRPLAASAGATLGRFLRAMHDFPVERAEALGLPNRSPEQRRADLAAFLNHTVVRRVFPVLSEAAQAHVRQTFDAFLDRTQNFDWLPAVSHGDIDDCNVLADRDTGELTGVIDWGDIRIGDPAGDFTAILYGDLGEAGLRPQLQSLLEAYGLSDVELDAMRPRCRFYNYLWPLHGILYGLDTGDDTFVQREVASLNEQIERQEADA